MRVLLDSSVLISSFFKPENPVGILVQDGLGAQFEMCASLDILEEVERSLQDKLRLRKRYRYTDEEIAWFITSIAASVFSELPAAAALAADADYIVTGDADRLALCICQGIPIVTVRAFLDLA